MTEETPFAPRVLMVESETGWRGGQRQLALLLRGMCDLGCRVGLAAAPRGELRRRTRGLPVEFHAVGVGGGMDVVSAWRLRSILRRGDYAVVHSHSSHAHGVAAMACAGLDPKPLRVVSRRVEFPVGGNAASALKYRRGADLFLAISPPVRDVLVAGGVPESRIRVVPSGIDLDAHRRAGDGAAFRRELGIGAGASVVGTIAALTTEKGLDDLVRAAAILCGRLEGVRFVVVGGGPLRDELVSLARSLGLSDRVRFAGFRDDVAAVLRAFDCFVLPSRREGLGTSIMDAQAAGVPVVATRTGGIPELVEDGETGLLVEVGESAELAAAVERMLNDKSLKNRCVTSAAERSRGYDYRRMVYKTLDAYRAPLGQTPVRGGNNR
jgi:glycosyltransferase involved in cell wall biosynthesis